MAAVAQPFSRCGSLFQGVDRCSDPVRTLRLGFYQLVAGVRGCHAAEAGGVDAVARNGFQFHLSVQRHAELEDMLAGLLCQLFAVRIQSDSVLVGVDLDLDLLLGAVGEPLGADVDEVFLAPPCFIEVEAVLLVLRSKVTRPLWFMPGSPP